jgi:hypothetical protein
VLDSFDAAPTNRVIQIPLTADVSQRFYRLRLESGPAPGELNLNSIQLMPGNQVLLDVSAPAYQSCTLLFAPSLSGVAWSTVTNYPAAPTNQVIQLTVPRSGPSGFYRLRSP